MYRSHDCGQLRISDVNKNVTLSGWVQRVRNLGGMTFVDLRDRYGRINATADGDFLVKVSSVGYDPLVKHVSIKQSKNVNLGKLQLKPSAILLDQATVKAYGAKVAVKRDTFIYNVDAYRTPEGSAIEELVKKLPGAEVDDDGKITINGKQVTKILVDGKEFMTGDTKTAMKNLPTSIVNRVKAYDQKSDLARVTGIEDGNEVTLTARFLITRRTLWQLLFDKVDDWFNPKQIPLQK